MTMLNKIENEMAHRPSRQLTAGVDSQSYSILFHIQYKIHTDRRHRTALPCLESGKSVPGAEWNGCEHNRSQGIWVDDILHETKSKANEIILESNRRSTGCF